MIPLTTNKPAFELRELHRRIDALERRFGSSSSKTIPAGSGSTVLFASGGSTAQYFKTTGAPDITIGTNGATAWDVTNDIAYIKINDEWRQLP